MAMDGAEPSTNRLLEASVAVSSDELDAARFGFDRAYPHRSAKRVFFVTQALSFALIAAAIGWAAWKAPALTLSVVHIAALALFAIVTGFRLVAAAQLQSVLQRLAEPAEWPIYTILCPLYREANVTPDLVAALNALDYPKNALDVKLLVEGDDPDTIAAALAVAGAPHIEVVIIPAAAPRTKPKALNVGLARARGDFITVYDAEDRPHPQQLRAALAAFEDGDATLACLQAPLVIDNHEASWLSRQFAAEYAIQFRELLPLLTRLKLPLPLGGSSNHFRTDALRAVGGWDAFNVTEDADLGYRLAREGYQCGVIAPPTWEEAPVTLKSWLDQRTRWIKGHMQTWLVLTRNPIRTALEMGLPAFAAMHLMLTSGLIAAFVHGPLALVLIAAAILPYDLLTPADFALALFGYCVSIFAALTACALSNSLSHVWAAPTMPLYWPLSSIAAFSALFALIFRPHRWSKTEHGVSQRRRYSVLAPPKRHVSAPILLARGRA